MVKSCVFALVGLPASGKAVFCQIASKFDFAIVAMGDIIRAECEKRGLEASRETFNLLMIELRNKYGETVVASRVAKKIEHLRQEGKKRILVEGIRSHREIRYLQNIFPALITIGLHVSPEIRFQRTLERSREDDAINRVSFELRDDLEISFGISHAFSLCDYMINCKEDKIETKKLYFSFLTSILSPANFIKLELVCETKVNPTEDEKIIEDTILHFFPEQIIHKDARSDGNYFYTRVNNISGLNTLRQIIQDNSLSDIIRRRLIKNIEHQTLTSLYLNKQVAAIKKVSVLDYEDNPPLGPILIQFITESEDGLLDLIDFIAPKSPEIIAKTKKLKERKHKRKGRSNEKRGSFRKKRTVK